MATVQKKAVLITGCSDGGIGSSMAKIFHQRGYYVFVTLRDTSKAAELASLDDLEILELDVTDSEAISEARDIVSRRTGGKLDILVNVAGLDLVDPMLDVDIKEVKKLYDVNVWGLLAVVQAFAPLLIEAKGTVVNQSSIDAQLSMAFMGKSTVSVFASSKAAVSRISETLRVELEPLGVRVVTIMSGSVNAPVFSKVEGQMNLPETSHYYKAQDEANEERMGTQGKAMKVDVLAEKLVRDAINGAKGMIWHGTFASLVRYLTWLLPASYVDKMVNGERGLGHVTRGR